MRELFLVREEGPTHALSSMHGEALCAPGLQSKRTLGNACTILWAIEFLPEDLWTRNMLCPAERAVMLGVATSKRVRALLERLQRGLRRRQCE